MPAANVFAPVIEVGGEANVGGVKGAANASLGGASDNHVVAATILVGLLLLVWLHRSFKFSAKVGG